MHDVLHMHLDGWRNAMVSFVSRRSDNARMTAIRPSGRLLLAVLLLALTGGARAWQAAPAPAADPAAIATKVAEYMKAQSAVNEFSGAVLVSVDGKTAFEGGYGFANVEWEIRNTPQTKFRIGSMTKQFTSMIVMRLQEQGKLKVHDPICQYLTPCPDTWKPVTVHHLLTHTSGIPSYTGLPNFTQKDSILPLTHDELIGRFRDLPLEFEAGSHFKYNNSGYFLLGVIIEKITGSTYEDVLQKEIFTPLGMKDTGYDRPSTILPRRASGYRGTGLALANAPYLDMGLPYAAGSLYSTVGDLLIWDQALYTDKLLPGAAREAMYTPFKNNYAYGWRVQGASAETFGHTRIFHEGVINGFTTAFTRIPDNRAAVIVLSNNSWSPVVTVMRDLLAILYDRPYTLPAPRTVAKVDTKIYDEYVGEYALGPNAVMTVTRDGDRILVQRTGQPRVEMYPESETKFFLRGVDAQITFVKGEKGTVSHLILHLGATDQKAAKK
jgi:CubicO group peptidase (beta-lactamase class C family)